MYGAVAEVGFWTRYWSAPGGRTAVAVIRIAIGVSLLWTLVRIAAHAGSARSALYHPHGIWMLHPGPPSPALLAALMPIAWASTIAFTIGLGTRVAHAISLITTLALATAEVSGLATWTHQNVPPLLASIAFFGARGGDTLAIDALIRRWRRLPPVDIPGGYQWTLRLVQIAVASVFFVAACSKLKNGGPGLGWALSDNLRHQLLMRFDWIHLPRTEAADWIIARSWRYQTFALLNLCSQALPIAAVFTMRRPVLRAVLGLVWAAEVLALGIVMALWDTHWLPLVAAFIDWDRLAGVRGEPQAPPRSPRARRWFIDCFLLFYAAQAFVLNQRLNIYPFSSYPMFAEVRARPPYHEHHSYELLGGRIELHGQRSLTPDEQRWIDRRITYRWMWKERRPEALHRALRGLLDDARRRFATAGITKARLWLTVNRAPPYPAQARLDRFDLAIIGELDIDGTFRTALGRLDDRRVIVEPRGLALSSAALIGYRDDVPDPIALPATQDLGGFTLTAPLSGDPVYVAVVVAGQRWLVAQKAARGF